MLTSKAVYGVWNPRTWQRRYWAVRQFIAQTNDQLRQHGARVARLTGKSRLRQTLEILRAAMGYGKLSAEEYYRYQLYGRNEGRTRFIGFAREERIRRALDMERWYVVVNDKLLLSALLNHLELPTPRLLAVYHQHRNAGSVKAIRSTVELKHYLRHEAGTPFVAKPIFGAFGRGVYAVSHFETASDTLVLNNDTTLSIESFNESLVDPWGEGYLFQELLKPHPQIAERCGTIICCARLILFMDKSGPRIWKAIWRIPGKGSMIDNRDNPDTLIAPVDPASGKIGLLVAGEGPTMKQLEQHPLTGQKLAGFILPNWDETVKHCLSAATFFPSLWIQAWDIALTDHGPSLLEVNPVGGMRTPQLAFNCGALDRDLLSFLREHHVPIR